MTVQLADRDFEAALARTSKTVVTNDLIATARYYSEEWPLGSAGDPELDAMIRAISLTGQPQHWVDLGSGPMGPLWLRFIRPAHATWTDANGEHLAYARWRLDAWRTGAALLPIEVAAEAQATALGGCSWDSAACVVDTIDLDLTKLQFWPEAALGHTLNSGDLLTAIGSLGCLPTLDALDTAFFWLRQRLGAARFIAAFWMGTKADAPEKYEGWSHLYYPDCVAGTLTPDILIDMVQGRLGRTPLLDLTQLGGGRRLAVLDIPAKADA